MSVRTDCIEFVQKHCRNVITFISQSSLKAFLKLDLGHPNYGAVLSFLSNDIKGVYGARLYADYILHALLQVLHFIMHLLIAEQGQYHHL